MVAKPPARETVELETAVDRPPRATDSSVKSLAPGDSIGRYIVLDTLGIGGMGEVYAAFDPKLDRRVALKLLRANARDSEEGHTRLLREAQAIARVAHPNVVAVHDVGTYGQRVFIAMEHVEGMTLRKWLQSTHSWQDILAVCVAAGRGLAAAHEVGLVHRDFKPENVLIAADNRPRVLDFGLARQATTTDEALATTDGASELPTDPGGFTPTGSSSSGRLLSAQLTGVGAVMGTPGYMSPEQLNARDVDLRSDQFSFCVTTWEALYGKVPFAGKTRALLTAAIAEGKLEPPPGSQVPRRVRDALAKGLSYRASDRHGSMHDLLSLLEISERRRGRVAWMIAGGALPALAVIGFTLARSNNECASAGEDFASVWNEPARERIRTSFTATNKPFAADAYAGVAAALDAYEQDWEAMARQLCNEESRGGDKARLVARKSCLHDRLDEVRALTELFAHADAETVVNAVSAAGALTRIDRCALPRAYEATAQQHREVRAHLIEAKALFDTGRARPALEVARKALNEVHSSGPRALEAQAQLLVAQLLERTGEHARALAAYGDAGITAYAVGEDAVAVRAFGEQTRLSAFLDPKNGSMETSRRLALAAMERLSKDDLVEAELNMALGTAALNAIDVATARPLFERALKLRESVLGRDHPDVARAYSAMGSTMHGLGRTDLSRPYYERALEIQLRALGPHHPATAQTRSSLGFMSFRTGRLESALRHQQAAVVALTAIEKDTPEVANVLDDMALTLMQLGREDDARAQFDRALALKRKLYGETHPAVAECHQNRSQLFYREGRWAEAMAEARASLAILAATRGEDHPTLVTPRQWLVRASLAAGKLDIARAEIRKMVVTAPGAKSARIIAIHLEARLYLAEGKTARAKDMFARARELAEQDLWPSSHVLTEQLVGMGEALLLLGKSQEAIGPLERAVAAREQTDDVVAKAEASFLLERARIEAGIDAAAARRRIDLTRESLKGRGTGAALAVAKIDAWLASGSSPRSGDQ